MTSGGAIRENTIASLKKAGESGAAFVEFDVNFFISSFTKNLKVLFLGTIIERFTAGNLP